VVSTYAPDGDSVRFVPADAAQLESLGNAGALRIAPDGSVQLRMQGIDAPEVHYAGHAQPLAVRARDALLSWLGFGALTFASRTSRKVRTSDPRSVPATVLSRAIDAHRRAIA
jgi:endonuclease YncB( thermonuclease family)